MPELQLKVVALVKQLLGGQELQTPDWLIRPGKKECASLWDLTQALYRTLEPDLELPEVMRSVERRTVDYVFQLPGQQPRILEFDETQHFNHYRALTFSHYPQDLVPAFPLNAWLNACRLKTRLEGGGFGAPKPPLFPGQHGRHRQRAFRDALCDLLPPLHGYLPTLRIADFEVKGWLDSPQALDCMRRLLWERAIQN